MMRHTPPFALRRAQLLAAAAIAALAAGGLGAASLTSDGVPSPGTRQVAVVPPAHAAAAPPQSLALTADFFASMGIGTRDEAPAEPQAAPATPAVPTPCTLPKHDLADQPSPDADRPDPTQVAAAAAPASAAPAAAARPDASPALRLE
jgi:hypothetical protein